MAVRKNKKEKAPETVVRRTNKERKKNYAKIPRCRKSAVVKYKSLPEERIWCPDEAVDAWFPVYLYMARSVLTYAQEKQGIPNSEAMENSCTDSAEQYITDTLHYSGYLPKVALETIMAKPVPQKLTERWTDTDVKQFVEGITKHGRNFWNIQQNFLSSKDTKEIVDFYYKWTSTKLGKEFRKYGGLQHLNRRRKPRNSVTLSYIIPESISTSKIVTRSVSASYRLSGDAHNLNNPLSSAENSTEAN